MFLPSNVTSCESLYLDYHIDVALNSLDDFVTLRLIEHVLGGALLFNGSFAVEVLVAVVLGTISAACGSHYQIIDKL